MPLMRLYLNTAIRMCKITNTPISLLLHTLDLIGGDQIKELALSPGMNVSSNKKIMIFKGVIGVLSQHYQVANMSQFCSFITENRTIKLKMVP